MGTATTNAVRGPRRHTLSETTRVTGASQYGGPLFTPAPQAAQYV
jgi:hypothetical protein